MAITKIMCMKSAEHGNVAAHLKHSIAYICNEEKTENGSLVGGINCLPDFAYEQMIGTKEMFGQTGGRQGYHFIISLKPGEGTKEQMYEIITRFAEEFLGGEYEGVFSVHTDKDHLHGHLVYNSVNMVTGRKYSYKKGDWKNVIQPITNRLCEEYGLSIVAAEYSKDPVNMNRKQWEKEQSWGDFITGDMQYCRKKEESFDEFVFLMEKLGYEVKVGAHISVKAEGMRRSRRLDTLDEEFSVQNLQTYYEQERPYKYVEPPIYHPGYALHKKPWADIITGGLSISNYKAIKHFISDDFKIVNDFFVRKVQNGYNRVKKICDDNNIIYDRNVLGCFMSVYFEGIPYDYLDSKDTMQAAFFENGVSCITGSRNFFNPNSGLSFRINLTNVDEKKEEIIKRFLIYLKEKENDKHN